MVIKDNPELFGIKRAVKRSRVAYELTETILCKYDSGTYVILLGDALSGKLEQFYSGTVGVGIMNGDSIVLFEDDSRTGSKICLRSKSKNRKQIVIPVCICKDLDAIFGGRKRVLLNWMQLRIGNETAFKLVESSDSGALFEVVA